MSTKAAVLQQFLSTFGLPVFMNSAVPSDQPYPYITHNFVDGSFGNEETNITVNLWYYGDTEATLNAKVTEMSNGITRGGILLPCDGGVMWIKRGTPFAQSVVEDNDKVKRRYINLDIEYLTD